MRSILLAAVPVAGLVVAVYFGIETWLELEDVEMGFHGTLAIVLLVVFVLGIGVGLMRLSYWSHHRGHDERVASWDAEEPEARPDDRKEGDETRK